MNQKQINTVKRLINAKYLEWWKLRKEKAQEQRKVEIANAKKKHVDKVETYRKLKKEMDALENEVQKDGLHFSTYNGVALAEYDSWDGRSKAIQKFEKELAAIKLKIDDKILRLELGELNGDAVKVYEELLALFKE
jgi:hypothetical protein